MSAVSRAPSSRRASARCSSWSPPGNSAPEIAEHIHLSPATVKSHLQAIYDKLGVAERAAAVAEGMRRGFLE